MVSWSVRPYITNIARRVSSQMIYLRTYSLEAHEFGA